MEKRYEEEILFTKKVGYGNTGHIHRNKRVCTNSIENIPVVTSKEVVYLVSSNSEGLCVIINKCQKNVPWMISLDVKFTNQGELVLDFFASNFEVPKSCLLNQKHNLFVWFDINFAFLEGYKERIVSFYTPKLTISSLNNCSILPIKIHCPRNYGCSSRRSYIITYWKIIE